MTSYPEDTYMISPASKQAFLRDLAGRSPGLVLEGVVLVRKSKW